MFGEIEATRDSDKIIPIIIQGMILSWDFLILGKIDNKNC